MAATDAKPVPIKGSAFRITFPIFDSDGDLVTGATGLDSEVSKDGADFIDCTNEAVEITGSGIYYLDLTAEEMTADCVVTVVKTTTTGAKTAPIILYPVEINDIPVQTAAIASSVTAEIKSGLATTADLTPIAKSSELNNLVKSTELAPLAKETTLDTVNTAVNYITANTDTLINRLTSDRASNLDNLDIAVSDVSAVGASGVARTLKFVDSNGNPAINAGVWLTTDSAGLDAKRGTLYTNDSGEVTFIVDIGSTWFVWCDSDDVNFTNPTLWEVQ